MPAQTEMVKPYLESGVEIVVTNLEGAKVTLAVNRAAAEAGVKEFADLHKFGDKFGSGHRIGNYLDGAYHVARAHRRHRRDGGECERLRCPIELAYAVGCINEKAVRLGDQISPPMDGRFGADMISGQPLRNRHRDIIFTNIVRIEPSNGERFQSRMPDRRQIIAIEHAPFWQAASRNREAMGQDRTLGLFQRYPSKPHFELRKTVVISARMETATSAGPAATIVVGSSAYTEREGQDSEVAEVAGIL